LLGILCIAYGIFALFTPFTPGAWLIFIGAELLGIELLLLKNLKIRFWGKKEENKGEK